MDTRGWIVGTTMMLWQATLVATPNISCAADIRAGVAVEQVIPIIKANTPTVISNSTDGSYVNQTTSVITGRVDSLIFRTANIWWAKPTEIKLENNFTTETSGSSAGAETIEGVRANINGILSLSSGNTRISVIQNGLKFQSGGIKAELTKGGPKLQFSHTFASNTSSLNAELAKDGASVRYKLSF